jgi:undecaprenyl-diphosphatase
MVFIHYIILGIIQGVTEFLPVSSSGHLMLFQHILNIKIDDIQILFDLILHIATILALILFFYKDIKVFIKSRQNLIFIFVSFFMTSILGLIISKFKFLFIQPVFVASMLFFNGIILLIAYKFSLKNKQEKINLKKAVAIGLVQGVSVIPGISRSGSTISMALMLGVSREQAFRYSFILAIPTLIVAFLYQLVGDIGNIKALGFLPLSIGFIFSFVFGFLSLIILKKLILKSKLHYFGFYCLVVSIYFIFFN